MNSCIYDCKVSHARLKPKKNIFAYSIFMAYIDLDELEMLDKNIKPFGYNRRNLFSFFDKDHFIFVRNKTKSADSIAREKFSFDPKRYEGKNTKERIKTFVKELGLGYEPDKVFLLTNLRNFGYVFNPVSFYYCFDDKGRFRTLFSEVTNTYRDQKMYYMDVSEKDITEDPEKQYSDVQKKNYYISPFVGYDVDLHWRFKIPGEDLNMIIDSVRKSNREIRAVLTGKRREITTSSMRKLVFRYPFITFMIIIWIHFQALKLWIKGVPFFKKDPTDKRILESIKR